MIKGIQPRQKSPDETMQISSFQHGLNTVLPADRVSQTELSKCINWMLRKGGTLETRPSAIAYSNSAVTGNKTIKFETTANIGGTLYDLIVDSDYKIWYLDALLDPQLIGTLEGEATIISFNGVAMIFDGSYIKYLDGVSDIKIAYDAGSGLTGFQLYNLALTQDATIALGNATISKVAHAFTSQAWDAGYTIPITSFSIYLSKTGAPTGNITVKLFDDATDTEHASKVLCAAADVSATASKFTVYFSASDITTQMSLSTAYYISIEYSGGDAGNYISVACNTVTAGGGAWNYSGAAWHAEATKDVVCAIGPGRPPKGKFATIWNKRPWVMGDPDKKGALWYGNLSHLDWSTADGGGYLGIIDDDSNNFEVGAIASFYGNLYAFGTQTQPYLVKISGADPTAYAQETAFQKPWTTYKLLASAMNDLWFAGDEGVSPLSGVQEYGDLRTFFASDPILDRISKYWDTDTAFAAYFPQNGQYWLIMPSYHRVLVCHTKQAVEGPDGSTRYPWTEYEFYRDVFTNADNYKWIANGDEYYLQAAAGGTPGLLAHPDFITLDGKVILEGTAGALNDHEWDYGLDPGATYNTIYFRDDSGDPDITGVSIRSIFTPTSCSQCGDSFLMGGSDGLVRKIDAVEYKDMSLYQIEPIMATAYMEVPFTHANFSEFQALISSKVGGQVRVRFFVNGAYLTPLVNKTINLGLRDDLTVEDMTMDAEDATFAIEPVNRPMFEYVNFNARTVMMEVDSVIIAGYPIVNSGVLLKYRRLGY